MSSSTISARLDAKIAEKLEKLARTTNRSKSYLAAHAIEKYVEEQSWQIEAIEKGVHEADKGNFATDSEVKDFFARWSADAH